MHVHAYECSQCSLLDCCAFSSSAATNEDLFKEPSTPYDIVSLSLRLKWLLSLLDVAALYYRYCEHRQLVDPSTPSFSISMP